MINEIVKFYHIFLIPQFLFTIFIFFLIIEESNVADRFLSFSLGYFGTYFIFSTIHSVYTFFIKEK